MRFLSLFRTPKHQQFHIEPRYYDPVKEEMEEKKLRLKQQMYEEITDSVHVSSINFKKKSSKRSPSSSMLQLSIAIVLIALTFAWLAFGNRVFEYLLYLTISGFLLYKLRKLMKS